MYDVAPETFVHVTVISVSVLADSTKSVGASGNVYTSSAAAVLTSIITAFSDYPELLMAETVK
jgi:hypothetical protein